MIETLIEAERALTHGLIDQAERLYRQVAETDPRSSIAVMGLARVALERGDDRDAYVHGRAALAIDPENPAARHLVMRLTEVMAGRGEMPPEVLVTPPRGASVGEPSPAAGAAQSRAAPTPLARTTRNRSSGFVGRLLRRKPRSR
jgi:hypothetical protein